MTVTLLSLGLPMFVMGDEVRRTQQGNNNAYCQDNETSWFDWSLVEKHAELRRFVKLLIARRVLRQTTSQQMTLTQMIREGVKSWHGVKPYEPDWSDDSHSVALSAEVGKEGLLFYLIFNAYWEPLGFELPKMDNDGRNRWRRWIDTALESPKDIVPWQEAVSIPDHTYPVGPRSVVVLWASLDEIAYPTSATSKLPVG